MSNNCLAVQLTIFFALPLTGLSLKNKVLLKRWPTDAVDGNLVTNFVALMTAAEVLEIIIVLMFILTQNIIKNRSTLNAMILKVKLRISVKK